MTLGHVVAFFSYLVDKKSVTMPMFCVRATLCHPARSAVCCPARSRFPVSLSQHFRPLLFPFLCVRRQRKCRQQSATDPLVFHRTASPGPGFRSLLFARPSLGLSLYT